MPNICRRLDKALNPFFVLCTKLPQVNTTVKSETQTITTKLERTGSNSLQTQQVCLFVYSGHASFVTLLFQATFTLNIWIMWIFYSFFSLTGKFFDKDGNVNNWWSPVSQYGFRTRASCLANQYSKFEVYGNKVKCSVMLHELAVWGKPPPVQRELLNTIYIQFVSLLHFMFVKEVWVNGLH